jgi:hypothetical protein
MLRDFQPVLEPWVQRVKPSENQAQPIRIMTGLVPVIHAGAENVTIENKVGHRRPVSRR